MILKSGLPGVSSWQQLIYLLCSKRKVNDKSKNSYIAFYLPNIIIPLAVGLIIYTLLNPFSFISICIYRLLNIPAPYVDDMPAVDIIRNYVCDMLWAYSLCFAVSMILGKNPLGISVSLIISLLFCSLTEALQIPQVIKGTFDIADIILESFSCVAAHLIIITNFRRK